MEKKEDKLTGAKAGGMGAIQNITDGPKRRGRPSPEPPMERYKFSLSLPEDCRDYLRIASYNASEPGHIVSINQYICDLIRLDMKTDGGLIDYHKGADNGRK